jgi:glycosyltransferase involved in cell wall biosynthesis
LKILHVLYSGLGGHGNVFFSIVSADKEREFEYEVIFNGIEDVRPEYIQKCEDLQIPWSFVKKKPGIDLSYYNGLLRTIKKSTADITFLHSSAYILPASISNVLSRKKKKIIIRETQANNLKNKKEWTWLSLSFLLADKIVFLSEEFSEEVKSKLGRRFKRKKVAVIPNGIDLSVFRPGVKINKDNPTVGMQSRLAANKDHPTLLHAIALLKKQGDNLTLSIAGDGSTKQDLTRLSQELKIDNNVKFTGMLEESGLVPFLQQLTVYVHASLGETMSTAIMQAMACGLPIIASDVSGINNMIIHGKTGILVTVKNDELLSGAIKQLLNNPSYAGELGNNAYEFAKQHYSNLTMFKKYKAIFS